MDAEQQFRVQSTLPRLHLEEARYQALRSEEALHDPVPDPRGHHHHQGHHLQVESVQSVTSRQQYQDQDVRWKRIYNML